MQINQLKHVFLLILIYSGISQLAFAQSQAFQRDIDWNSNKMYLNFVGAERELKEDAPLYFENIKIQPFEVASIEIIPKKTISSSNSFKNASKQTEYTVNYKIAYKNGIPYLQLSFLPFRKTLGKIEQLEAFEIKINYSNKRLSGNRGKSFSTTSVLSSGTFYKLGVTNTGVHKITQSQLKDMGIDFSGINPRNIRIYGGKGGMLPEANDKYAMDDLVEIPISVSGENDGTFNSSDFILFYAEGPDHWSYDTLLNIFDHHTNIYDDFNYYYITASKGVGQRVPSRASSTATATHSTSTFADYRYHENEWTNLVKSGRNWYGEPFDLETTQSFDFEFPNLRTTEDITLKTNFVGRSTSAATSYSAIVNGSVLFTATMAKTSTDYTDWYARSTSWLSAFKSNSDKISLSITFNKADNNSLGWLDYIELNARRSLSYSSASQLLFRDPQTVGTGNVTTFTMNNGSAVTIWDVSDIHNIVSQSHTNGSFTIETDTLKEFVAFGNSAFYTPVFVEAVANQNLHGTPAVDYIVVTHEDFYSQASELAQFHKSENGLSYVVATTKQVFNEFGGGKQDPAAIRNFVKMFYDRANGDSILMPKYLLLFGDGSYDPKQRVSNNTNYVIAYESSNSLDNRETFVSDDFYGFLDDNEGGNITTKDVNTSGLIDIGIGRLVAQSTTEATALVEKIKHYHEAPSLGSWRNEITFIADDEDANTHIDDADELATTVDNNYPNYNVDKIFFDAYTQKNAPGGKRYPDVQRAINAKMFSGSFLVNYTGHGGEVGWAHERVLNISDINSWENYDKLPLFMTATCEFSRYDDPERTSAGELVLLSEKGGAIALVTTVRLVYSSANMNLATNFYKYALEPNADGSMPHLGDIMKNTKNSAIGGINNRKFTLLGDPALRLAYPEKGVKTSSINEKALINGNDTSYVNGDTIITQNDTLKALSKVKICGYVHDVNGNKETSFNGIVYPSIFDKYQSIKTLVNDSESRAKTFQLQKNTLYKGKATVTNGDFCFEFVVPKDIRYNYDYGKISYYAENGVTDAAGAYDSVTVGGTASDYAEDETGPTIDIYLNDESFVFGAMTDQNPNLIVHLFDENGINTVGNSFGHDLTAVLDNNTQETINLNNFYEADLDQYQSGRVAYPLTDLADGKHVISVTAWDVYNNPSEEYTEFIVANNAELALRHVLNYPNPFTTNTSFWFEHNRPNEDLTVQLQIFTITGRLIKTILRTINTTAFLNRDIKWNGTDDFGDRIGNGVYVYVLKVRAEDGSTAHKYEKLVIIN